MKGLKMQLLKHRVEKWHAVPSDTPIGEGHHQSARGRISNLASLHIMQDAGQKQRTAADKVNNKQRWRSALVWKRQSAPDCQIGKKTEEIAHSSRSILKPDEKAHQLQKPLDGLPGSAQ